MRSLFFVGSKLLGIYFFYWGLSSLPGMLAYIGSSSPEPVDKLTLIYSAVSILILFVFSFFLIFRASWLADVVKLTPEPSDAIRLSANAALRVGIVLIGVYVFATDIGPLIRAFYAQAMLNRMRESFAATHPRGLIFSRELVAPGVTLIFALFLVFGSKRIAKLISKL